MWETDFPHKITTFFHLPTKPQYSRVPICNISIKDPSPLAQAMLHMLTENVALYYHMCRPRLPLPTIQRSNTMTALAHQLSRPSTR